MLPNFLIIGAQKAGTSWLLHHLRQHPGVFMPHREVHYFDKRHNFRKGLSWYEAFFADAEGEGAVGEKTPTYLWANGTGVEGHMANVHENIHDTLPSAKLIAILRNPVDRAVSAVHHIMRSGRVSTRHDIDDLLLGEKAHLVAGHGVIEKGYYAQQLAAYLSLFFRDQIKVLIFEETVSANQRNALQGVCRFLDVDPTFRFRRVEAERHANRASRFGTRVSTWLPIGRGLPNDRFSSRVVRRLDSLLPGTLEKPSARVIHGLYEIYREPNKKLAELLGRRTELWLPGASGSSSRGGIVRAME